MIITNIEIIEFDKIKELINETSRRYNNFKDFSIVNNSKTDDKYIVFLYFYDKDMEYHKRSVQVEVIRNVSYREVSDVIKNASQDFENFIGQEILENNERTNFVDIILKYYVNKDINTFNLAYLNSWSSGCDLKTKMNDSSFKIESYNPTRSGGLHKHNKFNKRLYIESGEIGMLISLFDFNKSVLLGRSDESDKCFDKECLYYIDYLNEKGKYKISEYREADKVNWGIHQRIIKETILSSINVKQLSEEILRFLEYKFNVVIALCSRIRFEEELRSQFKNKKINIE